MAISTNGTVLARLAGALYNTQMSNATYKEVASLDPSALADVLYARDFSASTDAKVATTLVTNLGLASVTGLDNWVAAQLTAAGSHKGAKVVELLNSFAQMTADTTYGAYATAFNAKVDAALALSQTTDNAGGTFAAAGVVVVAGKSFALTAGLDTFSGSSVADAITATQATFQAGDVLNGGDGVDTLTITDSGTAAWTLPTGASVSNIENIRIKNVNTPSASATGNPESATFVFQALAAGQTLTIAGVTFTAGSSGATAAEVAAAFTTATVTDAGTTATVPGGALTGTAINTAAAVTSNTTAAMRTAVTADLATGGYTSAAGTAVVNSAVFTSNAATNANVIDLVATGTAVTGTSQVVTMAIGTEAAAAMTISVNGVSVAVPNGANLKADAVSLADSLNSYLGYTAAVVTPTVSTSAAATDAHTVTVTTPTNVNFGVAAGTSLVITNTLATAYARAAAPTITTTQGVAPTSAGASTDTIDASKFVGATSFVNDSSTGDVTYSALASTQTVTIEGNNAVTNGATSATWTSATSPTLNIINGTKAGNVTVVANSASKVTLTSTGAPLTSTGLTGTNTIGTVNVGGLSTSTLDIKADSNIGLSTGATFTTAAKAITVSGAATSVNLGAGSNGTTAITASNLESIDASGMTVGGVVVALTTGTKSFAGGAGNDTVATAAFTNTGVVVDAGAGTGDTLIIAAATDLDTTSEAAVYKNFETVRAASGSFDASLVPTATSIQMTGAGTLSNLTATQAANVQIRTSGAYTASLKDSTGSADVLTVKLGTGTTTAAATSISTGLTANGFETINLQTNAGSTSAVGADKTSTIAAFTADKATAINLSGNSFVLSNIATTKAVTIDGSALTGDGQATPVGFTVAGNAVVGSTVTGSAFADTFTLGTVGSTYNAGAGNDTIKSTVANLLSSAVYNTVDAGAGVDTLNITDGAAAAVTMVDNTFRNLSGVEKITVDSTTSAAISITTGGWFDKSFAATGAEITGTTTTGTFTVDASTFTGALKVTATTVGTGTTEGAVAITTGYGNDTVVVSNASAGGDGAISTGAGNDTITGGGDADVITGGTGADVMTGGAGADTFVFAAGDSGLPSDTNFDTVTDFTTNSDIISLGAYTIVTYTSTTAGTASISSSGIATFQTADVTLAQRIAATENGINAGGTATAGQTAVFQYLNDAYVFVSDGIDGVGANDRLIKLVGIDTTATATDVVTAVSAGSTFKLA